MFCIDAIIFLKSKPHSFIIDEDFQTQVTGTQQPRINTVNLTTAMCKKTVLQIL